MRQDHLPRWTLLVVCAAIIGASSGRAFAQQSSDALPPSPGTVLLALDSPSSQPGSESSSLVGTNLEQNATPPAPAADDHQDGQTKRILGIIPNFRSVNVNVKLPPQPVKEKFITATQDSFDYSSFILPALIAAESQLTDATPEFHQGVVGYGRYYWHALVDQTSENYFVEFIVPAVAHEDTRFYTLGSGGFWKRTEYALSRVVVTRTDSGRKTFNSGEILGAGMSAGLSNLYYPQSERTAGNTIGKWVLNVAIDAISYDVKEFWPNINHALFHEGDYNKGN